MTKEITKANILQEIQDKFKLRDLVPEKFTFSEMVIPTYNVEQHLLRAEVKSMTKSVTSGPAALLFHYVKSNERWHVHRYNVIFVTGAYTVAGLMILRPSLTDYIYVDLKAAQNTSYAVDLPKDIVLSPGEWLALYIDGYTSTGNLILIVDVTVEELR